MKKWGGGAMAGEKIVTKEGIVTCLYIEQVLI